MEIEKNRYIIKLKKTEEGYSFLNTCISFGIEAEPHEIAVLMDRMAAGNNGWWRAGDDAAMVHVAEIESVHCCGKARLELSDGAT